MKIYPAIDLKDGNVVQLVGGDPDQVAVRGPGPKMQVDKWLEAGAKRFHVVDLDAALGGSSQWHLLSPILGAGMPVQFGGGVRHMVQIQQLLELGLDSIIIGTQGVRNPEWLRELGTIFPHRITLAVDARGRDVVVEGWTESTGIDVVELARRFDESRLAGFLYTNVEKEGRLEGIDMDVVRDLCDATPNTPLIVSGGITTMEDLERLSDAGVDGVVLGMSIYTGSINLKEATERFEGVTA